MEKTVYHELRAQLDQYSIGYPATESGIELKILERLFSEAEARLFLDLSMMLEAPASVAERTGRDPQEVERMLGEMARRGLVFRHRGGEAVRYAAIPFVVGIYEFQVGTLDRELAGMLEQYMEEAFQHVLSDNIVPMRTVPVRKALDATTRVAPWEDARGFLEGKKKIAVAECLCRKQKGLLDQGCDKPREVCIMFDSHADYYVENGMARFIDEKEALSILDTCEQAGLVNQPHNTVNPGGMCNCCGDCCGILQMLKHLPRPVDGVYNDYFAAVDSEMCDGCATCLERCQMEALAIGEEGTCEVDLDRCIGCGLCVTTCPTEALRLEQKPEDQRRTPPASGQDLMLQTAQVRGTTLIPLSAIRKQQE